MPEQEGRSDADAMLLKLFPGSRRFREARWVSPISRWDAPSGCRRRRWRRGSWDRSAPSLAVRCLPSARATIGRSDEHAQQWHLPERTHRRERGDPFGQLGRSVKLDERTAPRIKPASERPLDADLFQIFSEFSGQPPWRPCCRCEGRPQGRPYRSWAGVPLILSRAVGAATCSMDGRSLAPGACCPQSGSADRQARNAERGPITNNSVVMASSGSRPFERFSGVMRRGRLPTGSSPSDSRSRSGK